MSVPTPPDDETRAFIQGQQEREYRKLSLAMGLGADPRASCERITRPPMPVEHATPGTTESIGGLSAAMSAQLRAGVADLHQRYYALGVPTPFEDRNQYPMMAMMLDELQATFGRHGGAIVPSPAVATLPSGEVDARVIVAPRSGVPVVFFEQGLFHYLGDFAWLMGWALPPIPVEALSADLALTGLPHSYTMPPEAPQYFASSLNAYVVSGTPLDTPTPIPRPAHNLPVAAVLLSLMQRFVMAHELSHIKRGHLDQPPSMEQEYEADAWGMAFITRETLDVGSWGLGFWACDLALTALHFLYLAIGIGQFGDAEPQWISPTHPDPLSRRNRLRRYWAADDLPPFAVAAAGELCGMSDGLLANLWQWTTALLMAFHHKGARPSPLWKGLIGHTFTAET